MRDAVRAHGALCTNAVHMRRAIEEARAPQKQAPETRSPLGVRLGGLVNCALHESSRGRMNGSPSDAVCEPIRSALCGTDSQIRTVPGTCSHCEFKQLGPVRWDTVSGSQRPATNAGAIRRVPKVCSCSGHIRRWSESGGQHRNGGCHCGLCDRRCRPNLGSDLLEWGTVQVW